MAGNYPDVPDARIAYDKDGTLVFNIQGGVSTALTTTQVGYLNDEDTDSYPLAGMLLFMFPEPYDLAGYFASGDKTQYDYPLIFDVSANTTNGIDGTWTTIQNPWIFDKNSAGVGPDYRTLIQNAVATNIIAARFNCNNSFGNINVYAFHLFGRAHNAAGDRLELWHPTLNQRLGGAGLDWGNARRGTTADLTFRVKNCSATKTANGVALALDAPSDTSPTVVSQHSLDYNGGGFGSTASIGTLAAGAISNLCTLRRTTASNATLSLWVARVLATATSFT